MTIAATNAVLALLALAAIPTLVTGQFDLSLGFQLAFAQSICAGLIIYSHWDPFAAVAATLLWLLYSHTPGAAVLSPSAATVARRI